MTDWLYSRQLILSGSFGQYLIGHFAGSFVFLHVFGGAMNESVIIIFCSMLPFYTKNAYLLAVRPGTSVVLEVVAKIQRSHLVFVLVLTKFSVAHASYEITT